MGSSHFMDVTIHFLKMRQLQNDLLMMATVGLENEVKLVETEIAIDLALYARDISPYLTGSLSSSHTVTDKGEYSLVHINPATTNPFSELDPWQYGPLVHARDDGRSDFYNRTVDEYAEYAIEHNAGDFIKRIEFMF